MPNPRDEEPIYSRGRYRLEWDRRADGSLRSPYPQIVWYDAAAGRNRSKSTGTPDVAAAEDALDRLYLQRERGQAVCQSCGQPIRAGARHLVTTAIADYLVAKASKPSISSIRPRLGHVQAFLEETDRIDTACEDVDEDWIEEFRDWAAEVPVVSSGGKILGDRAPGTVEASVRQLAAVVNFAHGRKDTLYPAAFAPKPADEVSRTPAHRSDVAELARMFRYCLYPKGTTDKVRAQRRGERLDLLRFLQISVATWARPDAAHDVSTAPKRHQWHSAARALNLNPKDRAQTKKYRPIVPVAHQVAPLLDACDGFFVKVESIRKAFETMQRAIGLPGDRESGQKLIRRSMSHLARQRLGERDWVEGQLMLGHRRPSTSDTYAPFDPGYLRRALEVTEAIIDEISASVPGAFHRSGTGALIVAGGRK